MSTASKHQGAKVRREMFFRYFLPGFLYLLGTLLIVFLSGTQMTNSLLLAQNAGSTAPGLLREGMDNCNLGLIGTCNRDTGAYIAGPEAILDTWIFSEAIPWWVSFFIAVTAGVSVLMIMFGGIFLLISGDRDEMKKKGINTITWALVGLVIVLFAFVIISILENLPLPGSTADPLSGNPGGPPAANTRP